MPQQSPPVRLPTITDFFMLTKNKERMKRNYFRKYDVQIIAAMMMLAFGMILTFMAFVDDPYGEVPESTQSIFGRCLMFSGSMLGVGAYVSHRFSEIDKRLNERQEKEDRT